MKNLIKMALSCTSGLLLVPFASAQATGTGSLPTQGSTEVTFSGVGESDKSFDNGSISLEGSWGVYYTERVLLSVRQSLSNLGDGDDWSGATLAAVDYHFSTDTWRPFVGLNAGLRYGGNHVGDDFAAGAQAGLKFYVQNDTFVFGRADYSYTFDKVSGVDDAWDRGRFGYAFGFGMNF